VNNGIVKEISIEEVSDQIEFFLWENGYEFLKITECFNQHGIRNYILRGLHMDVVDETEVNCSDYDSILSTNSFVLMSFLKTQIIASTFYVDDLKKLKLNFNNGYIIIETI